jgi:hypothetical protein
MTLKAYVGGRMTREDSARWHLVRILSTVDSMHRLRGGKTSNFERAFTKLRHDVTRARIALRRSTKVDRLTIESYRYQARAKARVATFQHTGV